MMIYKYLFTVTIILFFLSSNSAQTTPIDSLQYFPNDSMKLDFLSDKINKNVYADPSSTIIYATVFDSIAKKTNNKSNIVDSHNLLGMAYYVNEQFEKAIEQYIIALDQSEYLTDVVDKARILNNLATCYQVRGELEYGVKYYQQALEIYESLKDSLWVAHINSNLGLMLLNNKKLVASESHMRKALRYYTNNNETTYEGYNLLNLGNLLVEKAQYRESIAAFERAIELVPEVVTPLLLAAALAGIGVANSRMDNYKVAEKNLLLALEKSKNIGSQEQTIICHQELAILYEKTKQHSAAIHHFKKYSSAKDSLYTLEKDGIIANIQTKYETEKKEKEIALLNSHHDITQAKLQGSRRLTFALLVGLGVVCALLYWLYSFNKKIKKASEERDVLLREIHHRVKNNLQVISALLDLQSRYIKDESALDALRQGHDRVESMALIHKDLYQHDDLKGVNTQDYLEKLIDNLFESYKINEGDIELKLDIDELWLDVDTMIPLGLTINELISNALKHAFVGQTNGQVIVRLKEQNEMLHLSVHDNGKGIVDFEKSRSKSFGYSLIDSFAKKLKADVQYIHDNGFGIQMHIRAYEKTA